jgi:hypothetical protein
VNFGDSKFFPDNTCLRAGAMLLLHLRGKIFSRAPLAGATGRFVRRLKPSYYRIAI